MINKCACGCNPQPGKLNINSKLNKDFNKVINSPNQSELNKQMLIQQLNDKPGNMGTSGSGNQLASDLILEQLKELNEGVTENSSDIDKLETNIGGLGEDLESINRRLDNFSSLKFQKVSSLPTSDISESVIYLTPANKTGDKNYYDEYAYIGGKWELIGTTKFDVSETLPHIGELPGRNTNVWIDTKLDDELIQESDYAQVSFLLEPCLLDDTGGSGSLLNDTENNKPFLLDDSYSSGHLLE
jgi:hypothetical protein